MKRIHALNVIIDLVKSVQKIPDAGTLIVFPVEGPIVSQEADPSKDLHEIVTHFFLVENIFEDIAAILRYSRIRIDFRHYILDVVLLCLFR